MTSPATATTKDATATADLRHWCYLLIITVAVSIQVVHVLNVTALFSPMRWPRGKPPHSPMLSANDRSRWCTVWSLVERGTFQIDEINQVPMFRTIDLVKKEGHLYSSKPPLLPTLAAGGYWVMKRICGWDLRAQPHPVVHTTLLLFNVIPFGISLWVLSRLAERFGHSDAAKIGIVLIGGMATFLSTFINTFNNHTIAANCVLWTIAATAAALAPNDGRKRWSVLAGFFGGLAVAMELPAAAFLVGCGLLMVRQNWRRAVFCFLPAALIPLGAHLYLNMLQTGTWQPFYAAFGTELYNFDDNGKPSYWSAPKGIDRNLDSPPAYLFHCLIGHHGIFSLSPIYLWSLWIWCTCWRAERSLRPWLWGGLGCTVLVVGFYMTRTDNYNYGGLTSGLRWTFWLIPLWLMALLPALDQLQNVQRRWLRGALQMLFMVTLAVSVFSAMSPWNNPWTHPWLFQLLDSAGWINYR